MDNIILYLLTIIQEQYKIICWLLNLICRYVPLKQWAFDDSHSPKYKKYSIDGLPLIGSPKQDWDWNDLLIYYKNATAKNFCLSDDAPNVTFQKLPVVLVVAHPFFIFIFIFIFIRTMAPKVNSSARSVTTILPLTTADMIKHSLYVALTAVIL